MMDSQMICLFIALLIVGAYSSCSDPGTPDHGSRTISGQATGDTVNYTCTTGYRMDTADDSFLLTMMRTCQSDGIWSGSTPVCVGVTCTNEGPIDNAGYDPTTTDIDYQDYLTYICDNGFRTEIGAKTTLLTCQADTTWNKAQPTCERVTCPSPETVPFSTATNKTVFEYEDEVVYTCDVGYGLSSGDDTLFCDSMGNWNGSWPLCTQKDCGDPGTVDNAARILTGTKYKHTVTYTCYDGYYRYESAGILNRTCQADGLWSGDDPLCVGADCDVPVNIPSHSQQSPADSADINMYRYPQTLTYTCNEGYRPDLSSGFNEISCQKNGQWNFDLMECKPVHCPETNQSVNAIDESGTFYYGDTKTYTCNVGYELASGSLNRYCQANGTFTGETPRCKKLSCPSLGTVIDDGHRNGSSEMYRDVVTYTCDAGFQITGEINMFERVLICQVDKTWSSTEPSCEPLDCGSPSKGSHTIEIDSTGTGYGDYIEVECESGYNMESGNLTRECQADKSWSGNVPVCSPIPCGDPPSGDNVDRIGDKFYYPARVFYQCAEGYDRVPNVGGDFSECQMDGAWGGENSGVPTCTKIQCYTPEVIRGAQLLNSTTRDYVYENVIVYECGEGHEFSATGGPLTRSCGPKKHWSGDRPVCERISCGDPGDEPGTYKLGFSFRYEDTVNYTCEAGYEVDSGRAWSVKYCQVDGTWMGETPQCKRVFCGDPSIGNHSTRIVHGLYFRDKIEYDCEAGYRVPNGIYKIECIEDGTWTYPVPDCVLVEDMNTTAPVNSTKPPPEESEDSYLIGRICIIIMSIEGGILVLLDLTTISKDIRIMVKNIKHGVKQMKNRLEHKDDRVSPLPLNQNVH